KCTTGNKCTRTRCTRVKHCTFVTKFVRFEKKCFWTKRCSCKKCVFSPHSHHGSCDDSWDHGKDCHDDGHKWNDCKDCRHKSSSCKNKKFDHFWYKKRNC
ncbi:exosporium protein ExsB, partial [Bacillus sp. JJ783]